EVLERGGQVEPERHHVHPVEVRLLLDGGDRHPEDREDGEDEEGRQPGVDQDVLSDGPLPRAPRHHHSRRRRLRSSRTIAGSSSRRRWRKLAPSTLAASMTSGGTEVSPAMRTMAPKGKLRHTLTNITDARARAGWPSQTGQPSVP